MATSSKPAAWTIKLNDMMRGKNIRKKRKPLSISSTRTGGTSSSTRTGGRKQDGGSARSIRPAKRKDWDSTLSGSDKYKRTQTELRLRSEQFKSKNHTHAKDLIEMQKRKMFEKKRLEEETRNMAKEQKLKNILDSRKMGRARPASSREIDMADVYSDDDGCYSTTARWLGGQQCPLPDQENTRDGGDMNDGGYSSDEKEKTDGVLEESKMEFAAENVNNAGSNEERPALSMPFSSELLKTLPYGVEDLERLSTKRHTETSIPTQQQLEFFQQLRPDWETTDSFLSQFSRRSMNNLPTTPHGPDQRRIVEQYLAEAASYRSGSSAQQCSKMSDPLGMPALNPTAKSFQCSKMPDPLGMPALNPTAKSFHLPENAPLPDPLAMPLLDPMAKSFSPQFKTQSSPTAGLPKDHMDMLLQSMEKFLITYEKEKEEKEKARKETLVFRAEVIGVITDQNERIDNLTRELSAAKAGFKKLSQEAAADRMRMSAELEAMRNLRAMTPPHAFGMAAAEKLRKLQSSGRMPQPQGRMPQSSGRMPQPQRRLDTEAANRHGSFGGRATTDDEKRRQHQQAQAPASPKVVVRIFKRVGFGPGLPATSCLQMAEELYRENQQAAATQPSAQQPQAQQAHQEKNQAMAPKQKKSLKFSSDAIRNAAVVHNSKAAAPTSTTASAAARLSGEAAGSGPRVVTATHPLLTTNSSHSNKSKTARGNTNTHNINTKNKPSVPKVKVCRGAIRNDANATTTIVADPMNEKFFLAPYL